jgi:DNA-binding protein Fis
MDSRSRDLEWAENRMRNPDWAHPVEGGEQLASNDARASALRKQEAGSLLTHTLGTEPEVARHGATSSSHEPSIESLQMALEQMSVPPCPESLRAVLEDTSLERLVYWKLQALFEHFDDDPPTDVLRIVHEHVERPLFSLVLKKTKGNQSRAADVLGCNRNTLHRKLKNLAIQPRDVRQALKLQKKRRFHSEIENLIER